jgi:hypothetical protein
MAIVRRIALFLWASSGHDRKKEEVRGKAGRQGLVFRATLVSICCPVESCLQLGRFLIVIIYFQLDQDARTLVVLWPLRVVAQHGSISREHILYHFDRMFTSRITAGKNYFFLFVLNQKKIYRPSRVSFFPKMVNIRSKWYNQDRSYPDPKFNS